MENCFSLVFYQNQLSGYQRNSNNKAITKMGKKKDASGKSKKSNKLESLKQAIDEEEQEIADQKLKTTEEEDQSVKKGKGGRKKGI